MAQPAKPAAGTQSSVAPPVINAPESAAANTVPIPGCSVTDPYAETAGGTMALNLSCDHGEVHTTNPSAQGKKLSLDLPLSGVNAALATLTYLPPAMAVEDSITINVWNQAGKEATKKIAITASGVAVPPQPTEPPPIGMTKPSPAPINPPPTPQPIPPDLSGGGPTPPQPGSGTGVQAGRIADFLCNYSGTDMFPSMDEGNVWGSWPADYRPDTVIAAYDWLLNGSTNYPISRVYTAAYRMEILKPWMPLLAAKGHTFTGGIAANGNVDDAKATLELAADPANGIRFVEGINEPNTDFGSGHVPPQTTMDVQDHLWKNKLNGIPVMGPSIVYGLPVPEGYISPGYCSADELKYLNERMDIANPHFYPPNVCDLDPGANRGGCFDDVVQGMKNSYGDKPISVTEWQPTLYGQHGTDDRLDGYYTPWMMLSAWRLKIHSMMWYPLFDYSTHHPCGFFPKDANNPRPSAYAMRALHTLAGDKGSDARTFQPGKLDYSVSGGQGPINEASPHSGTQHQLFQRSSGEFLLFVYNEQIEPGGASQDVTVTFGTAPKRVTEHEIRPDPSFDQPVQTTSAQGAHKTSMNATTRLFIIEP